MWSTASIPGKPVVSIAEKCHSDTLNGTAFATNLAQKLQRRAVTLATSGPVPILHPYTLSAVIEKANCLLLIWPVSEGDTNHSLLEFWDVLRGLSERRPLLVAILTGLGHEPNLSKIVEMDHDRIPFLITQTGPISFNEAETYILKFFAELSLHSSDNISGKMVWFSAAKATTLLNGRGIPSPFAVRS
jgi:hypothetical protein